MVSLPDKTPVPANFADNFSSTDQDVKDLTAARPETKWCLLELPQDQLDALEKGSTFYFQSQEGGVGLDDGGAVLRADSATFGVEFLENSNSLFLASISNVDPKDSEALPGANAAEGETKHDFKCTVFGQVRGQLITKPTKINVSRVRDLLATTEMGSNSKAGDSVPSVSHDALQYEVAASPKELQAVLEEGPFVLVDGAWRLLSASLERDIIDTTVNLVAAMGWNFEDIDSDALLKQVQQHLGVEVVPSLAVLQTALRTLKGDKSAATDSVATTVVSSSTLASPSKPTQSSAPNVADTGNETGDKTPIAKGRLSLDKAKIDVFKAVQLLRMPPSQVRERFQLPPLQPRPKRARHGTSAAVRDTNGPALQIEEFAAALQELLGIAEKPSIEEVWKVLGDQAYADEFEGTLHWLDTTSLPQDSQQRLQRLFELQSHWNPGRLAALVAPTLGAGIKVDAWLMKHTRAVYVELVQGKEERLIIKKFAM
mmetsp:Transcript_42230/g.106377  ORF Transcript_42230/g.106377 Transcript_42230/m.106377 type:complete len:485 (-) Transcript_42230:65-1519(-)